MMGLLTYTLFSVFKNRLTMRFRQRRETLFVPLQGPRVLAGRG